MSEISFYRLMAKARTVMFQGQIVKSTYPTPAEQMLYLSGGNGINDYEVDTWDEKTQTLTIKKKLS
jgi:hypothetical protein